MPYAYLRLDDQIRRHIEHKLSEHYGGLQVKVRSAQLLQDRGIEIRGISIAEPVAGHRETELLNVDEVLVVCSPSLSELLQGQVEVERIVVRRPRLRAARMADGGWNVAQLLPPPKLGTCRPEIRIESGTLEIVDPRKRPASMLTLRNAVLTLKPPAAPGSATESPPMVVEGSLTGDYLQQIDVEGWIDPEAGSWRLEGSVRGLALCPELVAALPSRAPHDLKELQAVRAQASARFVVQSPPTGHGPPQFSVDGRLFRGQVDDPRLPYPLTDLEARIHCDNGSMIVEELTARSGQTKVALSARCEGLGSQHAIAVKARATKLRVDGEIFGRLPPPMQEIWKKYRPEGEIDVDAELQFDGKTWRPGRVQVQCVDLAFTYHKFPYRLERATGRLDYQHGKLTGNVVAYSGDRPLRIVGTVYDPGPQATGSVEIRGNDLPLEPRLFAALSPKAREVIQSLHPSGTFQVYWRGWRDDPRQPKLRSHLVLSVRDGSVRYERFPYPLANIQGTIDMRDGVWRFTKLTGRNDAGRVQCTGDFKPTPDGVELTLRFDATDVPLGEQLHRALSPAARRMWKDLKPRGSIDLGAEVRYRSADKKLRLEVTILPISETTSIEPAAFPYRFDRVDGEITYRDGVVEMKDLSAWHAGTKLTAREGRSQVRPDGSWFLFLDRLTIDRLKVDRELLIALPDGLRRALVRLNPTTPVNIHGHFGLAQGAHSYSPLRSRWDLAVNLFQSNLDCGLKLTNVTGEVQLAGEWDGKRFVSRGELAIESLMYENLQFTEVYGPLWIDNEKVLLGVWAEKQHGRESRRVTAKIYDGSLTGDAWIRLGAVPNFGVQASLSDASLERFASESLPGRQSLKGKVLGEVVVEGDARGVRSLNGSGNIRLRDADIYELPLMARLLKVLSVRTPDATAFTRGDIKFRILGDRFHCDVLEFQGDAFSLHGRGEMNLDREVNLAFHATVGRAELQFPLVRYLVREASQQIMTIYVQGPLANPQISNQPFPVLNQALQQLQLQPPVRTPPTTPNL